MEIYEEDDSDPFMEAMHMMMLYELEDLQGGKKNEKDNCNNPVIDSSLVDLDFFHN